MTFYNEDLKIIFLTNFLMIFPNDYSVFRNINLYKTFLFSIDFFLVYKININTKTSIIASI